MADSEEALGAAKGEIDALRTAATERTEVVARQLAERERALAESTATCDELRTQLNERIAELAVARSDLAAAHEAQAALDALKATEAQHVATIAALEADCARHLTALDDARATSTAEFRALEVELAAARAHLAASTAAAGAAQAESEKLRADAVETHARLSREIGTLRALVAAKDQANAQLQADLTSTREEAELIVNDFNMLSSELEKRQEQDETRCACLHVTSS